MLPAGNSQTTLLGEWGSGRRGNHGVLYGRTTEDRDIEFVSIGVEMRISLYARYFMNDRMHEDLYFGPVAIDDMRMMMEYGGSFFGNEIEFSPVMLPKDVHAIQFILRADIQPVVKAKLKL